MNGENLFFQTINHDKYGSGVIMGCSKDGNEILVIYEKERSYFFNSPGWITNDISAKPKIEYETGRKIYTWHTLKDVEKYINIKIDTPEIFWNVVKKRS